MSCVLYVTYSKGTIVSRHNCINTIGYQLYNCMKLLLGLHQVSVIFFLVLFLFWNWAWLKCLRMVLQIMASIFYNHIFSKSAERRRLAKSNHPDWFSLSSLCHHKSPKTARSLLFVPARPGDGAATTTRCRTPQSAKWNTTALARRFLSKVSPHQAW